LPTYDKQLAIIRKLPSRRRTRTGSTVVEAAFILPVFLFFLFGLLSIGHFFMVDRLVKAATRQAARYGSAEGITSTQVIDRVREVLSSAIDPDMADIVVKDASVYDDSTATLPDTAADFAALSDLELSESAPRQMFLVRATVDYSDVALLAFWGLDNHSVLTGQAITRHE